MRAIKKFGENFLSFKISEIGIEKFYRLIADAFRHSNTLSTDDALECGEDPAYITQIPYNSGYIQDRVVYYITNNLANYVLSETDANVGVDLFFTQNLCWDFYDSKTLVLSINIVQNIVTVNTQAIELIDYNCDTEEVDNGE